MTMLDELQRMLAGFLPTVAASASVISARSAMQLGDGGAFQPYWLAMRSAKLSWRCRLVKEGGKVRLLFITIGQISARDRLDAEVTMEIQPVTDDEAPARAEVVEKAQRIEVPESYSLRSDQKLEFRFANQGPFVVSLDDPGVDLYEDDAIEHIQLELGPNNEWEAPGREAPWLLDTFVKFAQALSREGAPGLRKSVLLSALSRGNSSTEEPSLRDFLIDLAGLLRLAPGLVAQGDPALAIQQQLPLSMKWRLVAGGARLAVLINNQGILAGPDEEATFLAPCNLRLGYENARWQMAPSLEWPDFLLRGPLRDATLEAFKRDANWEKAAGSDSLARLGCTPETLMNWAENENRAVLMRAIRGERNDEVLLLITGELRGESVVVLIHADEVTYEIEDGTGNVKAAANDFTIVQADLRAETLMNWKTKKGGGKQLFCNILHGFLRWHALVRPLVANL